MTRAIGQGIESGSPLAQKSKWAKKRAFQIKIKERNIYISKFRARLNRIQFGIESDSFPHMAKESESHEPDFYGIIPALILRIVVYLYSPVFARICIDY
jgi:hypothetical protein